MLMGVRGSTAARSRTEAAPMAMLEDLKRRSAAQLQVITAAPQELRLMPHATIAF